MRDFSTKINDTAPAASGILDANEDNVRFEELENAVTTSGQTLDGPQGPNTSNRMLAQSLTRHSAGGAMWCVDSGVVDAHVLARPGGTFDAPNQLFDGLMVHFDPAVAPNTGASSVNAFGLGVKPLVNHVSGPLTAGAIDGRTVHIFYDSSIGGGSWVLPAWSNALYVGQTPSSPPGVSDGEGWVVNVSNQGDLNFSGLANDSSPQNNDIFAFDDDADTQHKGITWAQLLAAIAAANAVPQVPPMMLLRQTRASATTPAALSSQAWVRRKLNGIALNDISGSSVNTGTGQITLPAGTYRVTCHAMAFGAGSHECRLRNETDGATLLNGTSGDSWIAAADGNEVCQSSVILGQFVLAGQKVVSLEHYTGGTSGNIGWQGDPNHAVPPGEVIVDALVEIIQVST